MRRGRLRSPSSSDPPAADASHRASGRRPHQCPAHHRLDVYVGSVLDDGVTQYGIHNAHDWQVLRHLLEVGARELGLTYGLGKFPRLARDNVAEVILERLLILQESAPNALCISESDLDGEASLLADCFNGSQVLHVEHGHLKRAAILFVADDVMGARDGLGDEAERLWLDMVTLQVYERDAEHIRLDAPERVLRESAS